MSPTTNHPPTSVAIENSSETAAGKASRGLSTAAKAGIGVAIGGATIAAIAMFTCFYLRRRRRSGDPTSNGRGRRERREKPLTKSGRPDDDRSQIQPVLDGFPGSTGYDDVPSMDSSGRLHSTAWPHSPHSPTPSSGGRFYWTDREELLAARMNTPSLASYSPSPGTVSSVPRPNSLPSEPPGSVAPDSRDGSVFAAANIPPDARPKPSNGHVIISYGPNRVTPTPAIARSTMPPDGAVLTQVPDLPVLPMTPPPTTTTQPTQQPSQPAPRTFHERKFSWDPHNDPATAILPLPPYASVADFHAMEKGAIRTMAEPEARAELPPTKDGYYHFGDDAIEYELPADAVRHDAQLPYKLYRNRADGKPGRELEEQKFLLSDVEIAEMRARKKAQPKPPPPPPGDGEGGESYEMSGGPVG